MTTESTPIATAFRPAGQWQGAALDRLSLTYDARFVRRKRLDTLGGAQVVVDLPETTNLHDGDALVLEGGGLIEVLAAPEPLLEVTGPDLVRLAWHIGNRHTPCQIAPNRLLIQRDHVLAAMLRGLGAQLAEVDAPFTPEGGAYGMGRTMGHSHAPGDHDAKGHHQHLSASDFDDGGE
jgi:urease accessory protein